MEVTYVNSAIFYMKCGDDISLLYFKIVFSKALIGRYGNCSRPFSTPRQSKQKSHELSMNREVQNGSSDLKSFVSFQAYGEYLYLKKKQKLFFEEPFVVFHHDVIACYIPFKK